MKALIGCEESQAVCLALRKIGVEAYSCDTQFCTGGHEEWHIHGDLVDHLLYYADSYNFFGCHPPCTYLANSGVCWLVSTKMRAGFVWSSELEIYYNPLRWQKMIEAADFFKFVLRVVKLVGMGYVENPIMHKYARDIIGENYTQIIHPYEFGHTERKSTCLWVVGLPKLVPTNNVLADTLLLPKNVSQRLHYLPPSPDRASLRSKTYFGVAEAIASQWVNF